VVSKKEKAAAVWDSISADATRLVYSERGTAYNHPAIDYSRTVDIFRGITGVELTAEEGVLFMVAVKLSRIANGLDEGHPPELMRDSLVDLAGYAECLWGVVTFDPEKYEAELIANHEETDDDDDDE
jgi:hypothetical protein